MDEFIQFCKNVLQLQLTEEQCRQAVKFKFYEPGSEDELVHIMTYGKFDGRIARRSGTSLLLAAYCIFYAVRYSNSSVAFISSSPGELIDLLDRLYYVSYLGGPKVSPVRTLSTARFEICGSELRYYSIRTSGRERGVQCDIAVVEVDRHTMSCQPWWRVYPKYVEFVKC